MADILLPNPSCIDVINQENTPFIDRHKYVQTIFEQSLPICNKK